MRRDHFDPSVLYYDPRETEAERRERLGKYFDDPSSPYRGVGHLCPKEAKPSIWRLMSLFSTTPPPSIQEYRARKYELEQQRRRRARLLSGGLSSRERWAQQQRLASLPTIPVIIYTEGAA